MSETEAITPLSDEEAQQKIKNMFLALDSLYQLHAPQHDEEDNWTCTHCSSCDGDVSYPCQSAAIILVSLGVLEPEDTPANEETPTE